MGKILWRILYSLCRLLFDRRDVGIDQPHLQLTELHDHRLLRPDLPGGRLDLCQHGLRCLAGDPIDYELL